MDPVDDLIKRLKRAPNLNKVAALACLHRATVLRIKSKSNAPNMETFKRLSSALNGIQTKSKRKSAGKVD